VASSPEQKNADASPADRRASPRFDLEVEVGFETDSNFYTGLTQDISSGGLFVATHQLRRVGDRIKVKFALPGRAEPVEVETEVRWVRESSSLQRLDGAHGMGLRFVDLSPEVKAVIDSFLSKRDSLFYDDD
jgi:uncharacterized protein (TIGR02266 family)